MVRQVCQVIKETYPEKIILSGGIHSTLRPEETLEFSDYVCVGEGEINLPVFIDTVESNGALDDIPGIFPKGGYNTARSFSGAPKVIDNLDDNPVAELFFDRTFVYSPSSKTWIKRGPSLFMPEDDDGNARHSFYLFPDRGCAQKCTYCVRPLMREIINIKKIRKRSPEHIIKELVALKKEVDNIKIVTIFSDDFLAWKTSELESFVKAYTEAKVDIPFKFIFSPQTYKKYKMDVLLKSNLVASVGMGIQTGSDKIRKIYERRENSEQVLKITHEILHNVEAKNIVPVYDFIIDCPWETEEDLLATLKLVAGLPKPFFINIATLTFFPGTRLYDMALEEGLLDEKIYHKQFDMREYQGRKIRNSGKDSGVFHRLLLLASVVPIPYPLLYLFWKLRIAPSQKLAHSVRDFATDVKKRTWHEAIYRVLRYRVTNHAGKLLKGRQSVFP